MATPHAHSYEVIYNVGLLDDLHNYFPALLYDTGRFNSVTQVFHYIRHQMNSRFNLFTYGASRYSTTTAPFTMPSVILTPQMAPEDTFTNLQTTSLLLGLLGLGSPPPIPHRNQTPFRDSVIVCPTAEQIEAATQTLSGSSLTEETRCAICQDTISVSDTCRKINHCGHMYHQICIDQWFQRSVYCPTCRHDIRESL